MLNYVERLNKVLEEKKGEDINNYTYLYSSFIHDTYINYDNYIRRDSLLPFMKEQYNKRVNKDNFNKKLFSKILFNNLYRIRQYKDDLIPYYAKDDKESIHYKFYASHQRIRRELENLSIDEIMRLSWELVKRFKKGNKQHDKARRIK